jgi:tetratricopeptide (TPR) repeat protein/transcriptional regulator with XRE-family HTH domain
MRSWERRGRSTLLRELRQAAGLTQEQLAERTGLTVRAISNIERGRVLRPHRHSVEALAFALGLAREQVDQFTRTYLPAVAVSAVAGPAPAQLPADGAMFTGRRRELAELDLLLAGRDDAVVVIAVDGMAGVGKTALAVHWAHRVRHLFPGGQLFANLRGYGPGDPVEPASVAHSFLRSLGVAATDVPVGLDERSALLRSTLATRAALIVLDNAAAAEQVRPLLPGCPGSLVLVTSRRSLRGLTVSNDAHRLTLAQFTESESVELLTRLLGHPRAAGDPAAVARLAACCAGLPLALRIVAERSARDRTLAEVASALGDLHGRLDELTTGEESTSVAAVLSWSYRTLPDSAATAFRRLGAHPGAHWDLTAAAALLGDSPRRTRDLLDLLVDRHLLERRDDGRYEFHDLLRAYAGTLAEHDDTVRPALRGLFDHYVRGAVAAADRIAPRDPHRRPVLGPGAPAGPEDTADPVDPAAWLTTELPTLLAVAEQSGQFADATHARDLSTVLWHSLRVHGHYDAARALHALALAEARRHGDAAGTQQALIDLGGIRARLGDYDEAVRHLEECLAITGAPLVTGRALNTLGIVYAQIGRYELAATHLHRSVAFARETGDSSSEGRALSNLGYVHERLGRLADAHRCYQQCLTIARTVGDRPSEAIALHNLGDVCRAQRRYPEALDFLRRSLAVSQPAGHREAEGYALAYLGFVHDELGRHAEARRYQDAALAIATDTGIRPLQTLIHNGLGDNARARGDVAEALAHYSHALELARDTSEQHEECRALTGIAAIHHDAGREDTSRGYRRQADRISVALGVRAADGEER